MVSKLFFLHISRIFSMNNQIEIHFRNNITQIAFDDNFSLREHYNPNETVVITDSNISKLYAEELSDFNIIELPAGEENKTIENIELIVNKLIEYEADRSTRLVGFGGGMITDMTGYAASIYMRGISHSFVPTSLLAMVDAAIGGKTAINYRGVKNLVGTFKHPDSIIINPKYLYTLPEEEFRSGLSELIKIALVSDKNLFDTLYSLGELNLSNVDIPVIFSAILGKAQLVIKDEEDRGVRQILNFGHTFGHIIETVHSLPHGIAVAKGMEVSLFLSKELGYLKDEDYEMMVYLIKKNVNTTIDIDVLPLINKISSDKKKHSASINFILLGDIGKAFSKSFIINELESLCERVLGNVYA